MSTKQVFNLVAQAATLVSGVFIAKGWGDAPTWQALIGGLVALGSIVASHKLHESASTPGE